MTSPLPAPEPCPSFLPVIVNDQSAGTPATYFIECVRTDGHDEHLAANAERTWTDAEGRVKRQ